MEAWYLSELIGPATNLQLAFKVAQKSLISPEVEIYDSEAFDHILPF
jgi:hypothetical protein